MKNSFLNEYGLLRSHKYFTQVQGQLAVCSKQYCDFVVWKPQGISVKRIKEDTNSKESLLRKLTSFYVDNMLPEIMTQMVVGIDEPSNVCSGSNGSSGEEEKSIAIAERGNLEK